ncbi:MAG: hypothetical protein EBU90_26795 [Proteobacteria bacterium]|nr:hypothetical protein [Pseudomonadota bacterium]
MTVDTSKIREVATYSLGDDICGRIAYAAEHQKKQQEALLAAADEIDRLRSLVEKNACERLAYPYTVAREER